MATFGLFSSRFAQIFNPGGWGKMESKGEEELRGKLSPLFLEVPDKSDGAQVIDNTHYHSPSLAVEASFQTSSSLVNEYRAMALDLDVDAAVDDIVNAIVTTDEDEPPVLLDVSKTELSKAIQEKMKVSFSKILDLMDFNQTGYEKVRQWYIDGRQYYQVIVDDSKKKEGIQSLVHLDPRALKKIKEVKKEMGKDRIERIVGYSTYYIYNTTWAVDTSFGNGVTPTGSANSLMAKQAVRQALKIEPHGIVSVNSGILSPDGGMIFSHLEKARKPLNNLKMMRDALVIYRITRAPERRVFYVDVGSLPPKSAESYIVSFMNKNKSKMSYDPTSGKVSGHAYQQSMLEDFWLPRREGGRGTEVDTLQGAQNLGQIDDVLYFQKLLFRSLNVPAGRLENDQSSVLIGGRQTEITRDEWKFNKFVKRLRRRYSMVFKELLKTECILTGIMTADEWEEIQGKVRFDFTSDSFVKEQQEDDSLNTRIGTASSADSIAGKYVSRYWIRKNILKMTDEEIKAEDALIETETKLDAERNKIMNPMPEGDGGEDLSDFT